jgi:hypothetical protein
MAPEIVDVSLREKENGCLEIRTEYDNTTAEYYDLHPKELAALESHLTEKGDNSGI